MFFHKAVSLVLGKAQPFLNLCNVFFFFVARSDDIPFIGCHHFIKGTLRLVGGIDVQTLYFPGELIRRNIIAWRQNIASFNDIFELAYIARPVILQKVADKQRVHFFIGAIFAVVLL